MNIGIIIDCLSVAAGGIIGSLIKDKLPESFKTQLNKVLGLSSMGMGVAAIVLMEHMPAVIFALILGTSLGLLIHLGNQITKAAVGMNNLVNKGDNDADRSAMMVTATVLFCASGTGIYGALTAGMSGDPSILIAKSILDLFTAMIFACTLGKSVSLIAVPQFVTLMIMNIMLQPSGAINVLLQNLGLISSPLPFWQNATWARITIIVINIWIGIPYTMLQITGILQNIPAELYEAAKMDGANSVTIFFKITLPYMLFVTTPYLISSFVGNINNFGVIYLLSGGGPTYVGDTAGQTDLLVTWLYKLTVDQQYYNLGAVIGIMTFIILTIVTLVTYRNSGSYKNEEAFM